MRIIKTTESPVGTSILEVDTEADPDSEGRLGREPTTMEYAIICSVLEINPKPVVGPALLRAVETLSGESVKEMYGDDKAK
jgi:hypothetical protein